MRKTLLILAAGMGSRYGGFKQIDGVGPHGDFLIDYAVYDAIQAGFDKIVFVIQRSFSAAFKKHFQTLEREYKINLAYAYQDLNDLPKGFNLPADRQKPWGTGHAILAARNFIKEPFAVINADDFYGRHAFQQLADFLSQLPVESKNQYAMVGYKLGHSLSPNGWVSRGLCKMDQHHYLTSIYEHTKVGKVDGQIVSQDKDEVNHPLDQDRLVSMTMFGFTPDFFNHLQSAFRQFLATNIDIPKIEFFTPNVVNDLVACQQATMKVLPTDSHWFGVTYQDDKAQTVTQIKKLVHQGEYPVNLWKQNPKKNRDANT